MKKRTSPRFRHDAARNEMRWFPCLARARCAVSGRCTCAISQHTIARVYSCVFVLPRIVDPRSIASTRPTRSPSTRVRAPRHLRKTTANEIFQHDTRRAGTYRAERRATVGFATTLAPTKVEVEAERQKAILSVMCGCGDAGAGMPRVRQEGMAKGRKKERKGVFVADQSNSRI